MIHAFRILAALAVLIALACSARAQVAQTGGGLPKPASGSFTPSCTQSSTFLAAAIGVMLTADKTNYDTLICGLVADGVWNFDVLYIWAAPTQATALINLANPGTFNGTLNGSVSFSAYNGFTGDGSSFYIDSGFNPSTASSPNFVQNSATVGFYDLTNRSTGSNIWNVGCTVGACVGGPLFSSYNGGALYGDINSASVVNGGSPTTSQGAWNLTRTDAVSEAIYLNSNEVPQSQSADVSISPSNVNVIFFGFNTGFGLITDQMAAGWIGKGVGNATLGVNSCKINNRINTYMATLAVPKNVYSNSAC